MYYYSIYTAFTLYIMYSIIHLYAYVNAHSIVCRTYVLLIT